MNPLVKASLSVVLLLMLIEMPVFAAGKDAPVVRERILAQLQQAQQLIEQRNYSESAPLLDELARASLSNYERSQVLQTQAFQYYQSNQYRKAIPYYRQILDLTELPDFTRNQTRYSLAQLYYSLEDYAESNRMLQQWFTANPQPDASAFELHALVLYQLDKFPQAIARLNQAIALYRQQNKPPRQTWLQMLQSMHYQLRELEASIAAVEELLEYYPKKVYWLQLAGLHAESGRKDRQLAVLDSAYTQGLLSTENELKTLAYLLIEHKAPYPAAKILSQALERGKIESNEQNLRLLAGAWRQAKEIGRSIDVLESAAAKAEHGRIFAELAQLYLVEQRFEKALAASRRALEKGDLSKPGQVYNTLGIALFKLQKYNAAELAFAEAKQHPGAIQFALQWERHLQRVKRQADPLGG